MELNRLETKNPKTKLIFLLWRGKNLRIITYEPDGDRWVSEQWPYSHHLSGFWFGAVVNNKIHLTIGVSTNIVASLDLESKHWTDLPMMNSNRDCPGVVAMDNCLYVIGGTSEAEEDPCSMEKFDFSTSTWMYTAPLPSRLQFVKATPLCGKLYAAGENCNKLACYDIASNMWTEHELPGDECFSVLCMAAVIDSLYVFGEPNFENQIKVLRYNPSTDDWKSIRPLCEALRCVECADLNDRLVVSGVTGSDFDELVVFEYDLETDEWKVLSRCPERVKTFPDILVTN